MGELKPIAALVAQLREEAKSYEKAADYFAGTGRPNLYDQDRGKAKVLLKAASELEAAIEAERNTRTEPDVAEQIAAYVEREAKGKFLPATILQLARDIRAGRWKGGK